MLESLFNNIVCLNFIKKRIQYICFPMNFSKIFKSTVFASAVENVLTSIFILVAFTKLLE